MHHWLSKVALETTFKELSIHSLYLKQFPIFWKNSGELNVQIRISLRFVIQHFINESFFLLYQSFLQFCVISVYGIVFN